MTHSTLSRANQQKKLNLDAKGSRQKFSDFDVVGFVNENNLAVNENGVLAGTAKMVTHPIVRGGVDGVMTPSVKPLSPYRLYIQYRRHSDGGRATRLPVIALRRPAPPTREKKKNESVRRSGKKEIGQNPSSSLLL